MTAAELRRVPPAMTDSAIVKRTRNAGWWRGAASNLAVFAAGAAVATAFGPRTVQVVASPVAAADPVAASAFHRALQPVMAGMSAAMCVATSGDADRDFARAMIPHHQGAIEMAKLELLHGNDPRLRRLAQGIIVEQSQEIALMRGILDNGTSSTGPWLTP
jgi:uncharacterized protein (DUF305 family)